MRLLLDSFWRAAFYCLAPRVIGLSLLPLAIMVVLSGTLGYWFWDDAVASVHGWLEASSLLSVVWRWFEGVGMPNLKSVVAPLLVIFSVTPLLVMGGQTFDNDPEDKKYGFYVDLGLNPLIVEADAARQGAARADAFLQALGMGWKDYEPPYAYLIVSPKVLASLRSANLVDSDRVRDGQIEFETIFSGKFRLIITRANQGLSAAERTAINTGAGVDLVAPLTTFIVMPNSLAFNNMAVPLPVEVDRKAAAYQGGGVTDVWYRWGYVVHPRGYTWNGSEDQFASDANYMEIKDSAGDMIPLAGATLDAATRGAFVRNSTSALSLGILPIFHS